MEAELKESIPIIRNSLLDSSDSKQENILGEKFEYKYKIIRSLYKKDNEEMFLVTDFFGQIDKNEKKNLYFLCKINLTKEEIKNSIKEKINNLNNINSKYLMKIINYFHIDIKGKKSLCIIFNYFEINLSEKIHQTNFINSRIIWKTFTQLILGLNALNENNILPPYICIQNIFLDEENNIKIMPNPLSILYNEEINKKELKVLSYLCPEIISGENFDEKSCVWSLGCILYELAFQKCAFSSDNMEILKNQIIEGKYNLPENCDKDISLIIQRLICEKKNRLTIKELIFNEIIKEKIIKLNLFSEIVMDNLNSK